MKVIKNVTFTRTFEVPVEIDVKDAEQLIEGNQGSYKKAVWAIQVLHDVVKDAKPFIWTRMADFQFNATVNLLKGLVDHIESFRADRSDESAD